MAFHRPCNGYMADSSQAKWYVAHTYSGYENKVKDNIEKSIENLGMQNYIFEVKVTPVTGTILEEDFESGWPEGWTTISNDGDEYAWSRNSASLGSGAGLSRQAL